MYVYIKKKQEVLRELQEVEMELSEVDSRSERVEVLRKKKVASAVTRANDARRRAVMMNAKVAEIQAVNNAKVDASKAKAKGMESMVKERKKKRKRTNNNIEIYMYRIHSGYTAVYYMPIYYIYIFKLS
jgi:hypothetical protein